MFRLKPFLSIVCLFCDKDYQYINSLIKEINNKIKVSYQLILVDNREVNKDLLQIKNKNIKIVKTGKNLYQFMGRLKAIPYCKGRYTWFVDSDDLLFTFDFKKRLKIKINSDIVIYNETINNKNFEYYKKYNHIINSRDTSYKELRYMNTQLWNKLIKTRVLNKYYNDYKLYNIKDIFFEDGFVLLNAIKNSKKIQYINDTIYNYQAQNSCKNIEKLLIGYKEIISLISNMNFKQFDAVKYAKDTISTYLNNDILNKKYKNTLYDNNIDIIKYKKLNNILNKANIYTIESNVTTIQSISYLIYINNISDIEILKQFLKKLNSSLNNEIILINKTHSQFLLENYKVISYNDAETEINNRLNFIKNSNNSYICFIDDFKQFNQFDIRSYINISNEYDIICFNNTYKSSFISSIFKCKDIIDLFIYPTFIKKDIYNKLYTQDIMSCVCPVYDKESISLAVLYSDEINIKLNYLNFNKIQNLNIIDSFYNLSKYISIQEQDSYLFYFKQSLNNLLNLNYKLPLNGNTEKLLISLGFIKKSISLSIICCFCDKDYQYIPYIKNEIDKKVLLEYEIIWIDNRKKYKNIKLSCLKNENVINNKSLNKSQFYGRKLGAIEASKEYTWFIDPDDNFVDKISELNTKVIYNYDMIIIPKSIDDSYNDTGVDLFFNMKWIKDPLLTLRQGLWNKWLKTDLLKKCFNDFPNKNISYRDDALILLQFIKYCNVCGALYNGVFYNYNMEDSDSNQIIFNTKSSYDRYMNGYKNALKIYNTIVNKNHEYSYDFANTKKLEKVYKKNKFLKKDKVLTTIVNQNKSNITLYNIKHTKF